MAKLRLTEAIMKTLTREGDAVQSYAWDEKVSGFGVVIGATTKTFIARARVGGKRVKVKIGTWPELKVDDARAEAHKLLGKMGDGVDPNAAKRTAGGPTLREALEYHITKMSKGENKRHRVCSPRSIRAVRGTVELHLADYLDGPLVALTADALDDVRRKIERKADRIAGSNPANVPGVAVGNRLLANVSAIWRSYHKRHGLPVSNPTERLIHGALAPRETRIDNAELPAWYAKLHAKTPDGRDVVSPIRRDLQLVSMFTGVRADGVRHLRWEDVDYDEETIQITHAKGGKPYTLPLTTSVREILAKRQEANKADPFFLPHGGDHGWCFPSMSRDGERVIAVAEPKERHVVRDTKGRVQRDDDDNVIRESYLPGTHANRRTYNSVAIEIGVPREARESLMNHEGRGVNVKHYGRPQNWDYLRSQAELVETALWARIRGEVKKGRKLRAVKAA